MAWTSLSFNYGSILTSTKMTQMYDNFAALAAGSSGAPVISATNMSGNTSGNAATATTANALAGPAAGSQCIALIDRRTSQAAVGVQGVGNGAVLYTQYDVITDQTWYEAFNCRIITAGVYRVAFDLFGTSAFNEYARIYKNGAAFGTQRTGNTDTYVEFTEDLTFAAGDTVQLFIKSNYAGAGDGRVRDFEFRVASTVAVVPPEVLIIGVR